MRSPDGAPRRATAAVGSHYATDLTLPGTGSQRASDLEVFWEGGMRTELEVALNATSPKRTDTSPDLVELVRRLAAEHADQQIAGILARQGRLTATGLRPTAARVADIRERAGIPAAPPPDPNSDLVSILRAAEQLGVSPQTIRRWLADGLPAGEQAAPHAPFRIRLDEEVRRRGLRIEVAASDGLLFG